MPLSNENSNSISILHLIPDREDICCFAIRNAISGHHVDSLLNSIKSSGFRAASDKYPASYRNNLRQQKDDDDLAKALFEYIKESIPQVKTVNGQAVTLHSLNPRLRACLYKEGQAFPVHQDGVYQPSHDRRSCLTFLLYLNDENDYAGGNTLFFEDRMGLRELSRYRGKKGDILIFDHHLWHAGQTVTSGEKYILRSDLMYSLVNAGSPSSNQHTGYIWDIIPLPGGYYASASRDKSIKVWDVSGQLVQSLHSHENSVLALTFASGCIYGVSRDGHMSIWQLQNGNGDAAANNFGRPIRGSSIPANNSGSKYSHPVKDSKQTPPVIRIDTSHPTALSVSTFNSTIVTSGSDGHVRIWSLSGEKIDELKVSNGWVWDVIQIASDQMICCSSDGELISIDNTGCLTAQVVYQSTSAIRCITLTESEVAFGAEDGCVTRLHLRDFGLIDKQQRHDGIVRDLSANAEYIFSCGEDGRVIASTIDSMAMTEIFTHDNFATCVVPTAANTLLSAGYAATIERIQLEKAIC